MPPVMRWIEYTRGGYQMDATEWQNDIKFPKRKQIRLKEYDYSDPYHCYFITICVANKKTTLHLIK